MKRYLALCLGSVLLAGCSTARLAESVEKDAIDSEDAVIQSYDDEKKYSTAMQLMYLGTQKDPDVHNNLDELSKNYYQSIDSHNEVVSAASVFVWATTLSKLDAASFFFGMQKYDKLFGHYKGKTFLFIEPFSNEESAEDAYVRIYEKFKSVIETAYTKDKYAIYEYEESVFGDITKFTAVWDISDESCKAYVASDSFSPDWVDTPKELQQCHIRRDGFIWNPVVINGALDIEGVPKADRYFVVSYSHNDTKLTNAMKESGLKGIYSYEPAYSWRVKGQTEDKYTNDPDLMQHDIKTGLISPFPYLYRVEDKAVLMFKPE